MFKKETIKIVIVSILLLVAGCHEYKCTNQLRDTTKRVGELESQCVALAQARNTDNATLNQNWQSQVNANIAEANARARISSDISVLSNKVSTISRKLKGKK